MSARLCLNGARMDQKHHDKAVSPAERRMVDPNVTQPQNAHADKAAAARQRRTEAGKAIFRLGLCSMLESLQQLLYTEQNCDVVLCKLMPTLPFHLGIHLFFTYRGQ
jgi:hypothetical protein